MSTKIPPIPNNPITDVFVWRDWFYKVSQALLAQASTNFVDLNFTGSNLQSIETRQHNALQSIQGGASGQYYHLSQSQYNQVIGSLVYGSFSNSVSQYATANNTPTVIALDTTDVATGMSLASNKITIGTTGIYNLQFSIQFANNHSQSHNVWVWLRKNGTDLAGTGSKYDCPSTHGSSDGYLIAVANFFINATAGDYLEVVFASDQVYIASPLQNGVYVEAYTASTSPFTMPSIPSSVVTLTHVV